MKNTRRTFLQSLASIPLLGWAFASAKPAMPSLPPVKADTSGPIYSFDERLTLGDLYGDQSFVAGEDLRCGDFVSLGCLMLRKGDPPATYSLIVRSTENGRPIGMATRQIAQGEEVQEAILVRGWVGTDWRLMPKPKSTQNGTRFDDDFWKDREWPDEPWNDDEGE